MKTMQLSKTCTILSLLLLSIISISAAQNASSSSFCDFTPFPRFCRSTIPSNKSANINDYCRSSVCRSLSMTDAFSSLINGYLRLRFAFPQPTVRALQDCQILASETRDFLSNTIDSIQSATNLPAKVSDLTQTLLSAAITNHQTCLEGLRETSSPSSLTTAILAPLTNGSMSYSVSLALFKRGWGRGRGRTASFNGGGRKLFQVASVNVKQTVVVDPSGGGDFTTISDAVAAAPNNTAAGDGYYAITIAEGVYEEYVSIPRNKRFIMMSGAGDNKTVITGNRSVVDGWTTFNSATFAVVGQGFVAINITFQNTAGAIKHQAVAVRNGADLSTFYNCTFDGYQDTLYTHSLRQFYQNCDIYGTVDFIFGNAAVVFQGCNIYPRLPMSNQFNAVTAQGRTDENQNTGTSIQNCTIRAAPDLASSGGSTPTYLGRPWKAYSRTVVVQSFLDAVIDPSGWREWSGNASLDTLYYAEYSNSGPGSGTGNRVTWPGYHVIGADDAANFTVSSFLGGDGWLPQTGVPFAGGLL